MEFTNVKNEFNLRIFSELVSKTARENWIFITRWPFARKYLKDLPFGN